MFVHHEHGRARCAFPNSIQRAAVILVLPERDRSCGCVHSSFREINSVGTQPSMPPRPRSRSSRTTRVHSPRNSWMRTRVPTSNAPPSMGGVGEFSPLLNIGWVIVVIRWSAAFGFVFLPALDPKFFDDSSEAVWIHPVPLKSAFLALITVTRVKSPSVLITFTSDLAGRLTCKVFC